MAGLAPMMAAKEREDDGADGAAVELDGVEIAGFADAFGEARNPVLDFLVRFEAREV